jgi:hypothetical protein
MADTFSRFALSRAWQSEQCGFESDGGMMMHREMTKKTPLARSACYWL